MENIYFDIGNLLVKNLLSNDLNHDTVSNIYILSTYIAFFIGGLLMVSPFVLSFLFHKKIQNHNFFALFILGLIMFLIGAPLYLESKNHDMEQALIQSKEDIHMLAVKYNVDDRVALKIAQDILFCQPSSFNYTVNLHPNTDVAATATIQCNNQNYYGKKIDYFNAEYNLNIIKSINNSELFIMQN